MSGQPTQVVQINPPNSSVSKFIVAYDVNEGVMVFKLLDAENINVLQIGAFEQKVEGRKGIVSTKVAETKEIQIGLNDRIVGFKGKLNPRSKAFQ